MDGQCDLYIYDSTCGGLTVHVAGLRKNVKEPFPEDVPLGGDDPNWVDAYMARIKEVDRINKKYEHEPIGLPHDGESFTFGEDYVGCAQFVEKLIEMGYKAPSGLVECLIEDAIDADE